MGNEATSAILRALEDIAFANGLDLASMYPVADTVRIVLNRFMTDEDIIALFTPETSSA